MTKKRDEYLVGHVSHSLPKAQLALSKANGDYRAGNQEVTFPKYVRYVADAADLTRIVRHEKDPDFSYNHDFEVQKPCWPLAACCRLTSFVDRRCVPTRGKRVFDARAVT